MLNIPDHWQPYIGGEFDKQYMKDLCAFLQNEYTSGKTIYPARDNIFNALKLTKFNRISVVIIGQDPYHGAGQAHGLAFSVPDGIKLPPSLLNIYKEISAEYGVPISQNGNLTNWAEQGVLLLNATLTVEEAKAGSHQKKGWEQFTDVIISEISKKLNNVVFMLWGSYAQKKGELVDRSRHLVLTAPHPSPLSAHRGFLGCGHFKRANEYLLENNKKPINWCENNNFYFKFY